MQLWIFCYRFFLHFITIHFLTLFCDFYMTTNFDLLFLYYSFLDAVACIRSHLVSKKVDRPSYRPVNLNKWWFPVHDVSGAFSAPREYIYLRRPYDPESLSPASLQMEFRKELRKELRKKCPRRKGLSHHLHAKNRKTFSSSPIHFLKSFSFLVTFVKTNLTHLFIFFSCPGPPMPFHDIILFYSY